MKVINSGWVHFPGAGIAGHCAACRARVEYEHPFMFEFRGSRCLVLVCRQCLAQEPAVVIARIEDRLWSEGVTPEKGERALRSGHRAGSKDDFPPLDESAFDSGRAKILDERSVELIEAAVGMVHHERRALVLLMFATVRLGINMHVSREQLRELLQLTCDTLES